MIRFASFKNATIHTILSILLLLVLPAAVQAQFTYTTNSGAITITGTTTGWSNTFGVLVIPSTINSLPVTSIGDKAFWGFNQITSVAISDSVISIGVSAFAESTSLTNVTMGNGIASIGDWAFRQCWQLPNITIPASVTNIGYLVFYDCLFLTTITVDTNNLFYGDINGVLFNKSQTKLIRYPIIGTGSYTIPNSVTNIGGGAFSDSWLSGITIPNSVAVIESNAFSGCRSLTNVTIGSGITIIGDSAFWGCPLTNILIPNGTISLGDFAFYGCSLTNVTIPSSVTNIGVEVFDFCASMTAITVDTNNLFYSSVNGVLFNKNQTTILEYPGALTGSYIIPNSTLKIGYGAFSDCTLAMVTIPSSVTNIDSYAFQSCPNLTNVSMGGGVTSIGDYAFSYCGFLNKIILNNVVSIGDYAFTDCPGLTNIILNNVVSIGDYAFTDCPGLTNITMGSGITNMGVGAFARCGHLTSVTIPNSVTAIKSNAFSSCWSLTNVTIGIGVTNIESFAFSQDSRLTCIYFLGNAPGGGSDSSIFSNYFTNFFPTVFYNGGTTGWGATFGGLPAVNIQGAMSVSMTASPGLTNCAGTVVTFTTTPVNAGWPWYQWGKWRSGVWIIVSNSAVSSTVSNSTYTDGDIEDNDWIDCSVGSSSPGLSQAYDYKGLVMTVNPAAIGGTTLASPSVVCTNSGTTLTLSGFVGSTIQWQSSPDGASFNPVSGATNATLNTGGLLVTTSYRAIVSLAGSGSCANLATSTVATVTVAAPGQMQVSGSGSYDFGMVTNGATVQTSFTVTNTGCVPLSGTASTALPFAIVSGSPFTLGGQSASTVVVSFTPNSVLNYADNVFFTSGSRTVTNLLTGQGVVPLVASFNATPTTVPTLQTVMFRDASTGAITNRHWNFGDGTITNTLNTMVVYQYLTNGVKSVTLSVSGPLGTSTITHPVIVTANNGTAAAPTITPNNGTFSSALAVGMTSTTPGAIIHYTMDGTIPSNNSAIFTGLILSNSTTLKAVSFATGYLPSPVATANFTINLPPALTILTTPTLPVALQNVAYKSVTFQATNGLPKYTWSGSGLPAGLNLTSAGVLSGTPKKLGTNSFLVTVKDANRPSQIAQQTFSLTVTNPFTPVVGTYTGLIIQTNNPTSASSGFIQIVLASNGGFAGNLTVNGIKTAYQGQFDLNGNATNTVAGNSVTLNLGFGINRGSILGTVAGTGFNSVLQAELSDVSQTWTGKYNLVFFPPSYEDTSKPQGAGYATLTVTKAGIGSLSGVLNDGTTLTVSAPVSQYGTWPFYVSLYNKAGACISWITLNNATVSGVVDWFAPASKGYAAFNTFLPLDGSLYTTGPQLNNIWTVTFSGGGLASNLVKTLTLNSLGKVVGINPVGWSVTVNSGLFTGSFTPTGTKAIPFKGLLLQAEDAGFGLFQTTGGLTGNITLEPVAP